MLEDGWWNPDFASGSSALRRQPAKHATPYLVRDLVNRNHYQRTHKEHRTATQMSGGASVKVKVLFFASSREAAGCSSTDMSVTSESRISGGDDVTSSSSAPNTADLRRILADAYPKLAPLVMDEDSITLALNEEYVPAGEILPLKDGDTVALIPPISGG